MSTHHFTPMTRTTPFKTILFFFEDFWLEFLKINYVYFNLLIFKPKSKNGLLEKEKVSEEVPYDWSK